MQPDPRLRIVCQVALLTTLGLLIGATPDDSRSDLEKNPQRWTNLLEKQESGDDLKGWTRVTIPPGGKLSTKSQWSFDAGQNILTCAGDGGHDWIRWDKPLSDFIYHVEWRFVPVTSGKTAYNSGIYVRNSADGAIWHQAQTGSASGGYLFGVTPVDGKNKRIELRKSMKSQRVKPAGDWNTFELTCRGKSVTLWVNGAVSQEWTTCEVPSGYVGLEAEGYRIEFRNVLIKPL